MSSVFRPESEPKINYHACGKEFCSLCSRIENVSFQPVAVRRQNFLVIYVTLGRYVAKIEQKERVFNAYPRKRVYKLCSGYSWTCPIEMRSHEREVCTPSSVLKAPLLFVALARRPCKWTLAENYFSWLRCPNANTDYADVPLRSSVLSSSCFLSSFYRRPSPRSRSCLPSGGNQDLEAINRWTTASIKQTISSGVDRGRGYLLLAAGSSEENQQPSFCKSVPLRANGWWSMRLVCTFEVVDQPRGSEPSERQFLSSLFSAPWQSLDR